jgi:hypothetical protein
MQPFHDFWVFLDYDNDWGRKYGSDGIQFSTCVLAEEFSNIEQNRASHTIRSIIFHNLTEKIQPNEGNHTTKPLHILEIVHEDSFFSQKEPKCAVSSRKLQTRTGPMLKDSCGRRCALVWPYHQRVLLKRLQCRDMARSLLYRCGRVLIARFCS